MRVKLLYAALLFLTSFLITSYVSAQNQQHPFEKRQQDSLLQLRLATGEKPLKYTMEQGALRRMEFSMTAKNLGLPQSASPEKMALAFLTNYSDLIGVPGAQENMRLAKRAGKSKYKTLTFRQFLSGYPVYGAWLQMVIKSPSQGPLVLTTISGKYLPDSGINLLPPVLSAQQA